MKRDANGSGVLQMQTSRLQLDDFTMHEKLGEGTFGVVRRATHNKLNCEVAIKVIRTAFDDDGIESALLREINFLKTPIAHHRHIVKMFQHIVSFETKVAHLVFEYVPETLKQHVRRVNMTPEKACALTRDILAGVDRLHTHAMVHRDLKPQNMLVRDPTRVVIADFGLTRLVPSGDRTYTLEVATIWYRAPEVLLGIDKYNPFSVDTWSVGCVVSEIVTGLPLFPGDSGIETLFKIFQRLGRPTEWPVPAPEWSDEFPRFQPSFEWHDVFDKRLGCMLRGLFRYDHRERMSAREGLSMLTSGTE